MSEFQYPLYFEAKDLTDREKEKIVRYFKTKRESGGGECVMIDMTGDNACKVCFKDKEVQERVLQRKFHTISLPSGDIHLTVSRTCSPQTPNCLPTETFTKTSTGGLEKNFKQDVYLLYYLRDNPKAYEALQKQLSAIGCSVVLNFHQEEAVVRGDIDKRPGRGFGAAEKWEIQVDRVFIGLIDNYVCHHVLDPKQIRLLHQDASFASDDIRVYRETGYSVVVGKVGEVNERISNLQKRVPIRKDIPVVEKKFNLVKEEFTREMCAAHPQVKIITGDAMISLEGPQKEVQRGSTRLDQLMNQVKESRVDLPIELTTFINSNGVISKYQARFQQSLQNPVFIEVASGLILFSLSWDALDEAEAAIRRDLRVDSVELQGAAAVPPDLDKVKDILLRAKNKSNSRELRVETSFIRMSGTTVTKVQLVGYRENVNKLKEILHDYLRNHVGTEEVMDVSPELVDCFDKVLDLIGMKQTEVTFKASHLSHPCLLVSGPRCRVQEAQRNLRTSLASLISETLVLDGSGAQRFFQAEGKTNIELVESACKVIIREGRSVHSPKVTTKPRSNSSRRTISFPLKPLQPPRPKLEVKLGRLEDEQVNVLVAPMLSTILTSTEIGKCLLNKAGDTYERNFELMAEYCTMEPGEVMQVDAPPSLGCSKIFFIECLPWDGVIGQSVQTLGNGLKRCLDLCVQQGWTSVAFPVIGPGLLLQYPLREAVKVLTDNIQRFQSSASAGSLSSIHVVVMPGYANTAECYSDVCRLLNMTQGGPAAQPLQANQQQALSANTDLSLLCTSPTNQQSVFHILGLTTQTVSDAKTKLKDLYQAQCSTQTFTKEQLEGLTQDNIDDLEQLVEAQGLYMQRDQSGQGSLTVGGLKDGVSQVMQMQNEFLQGSRTKEMRDMEEKDLYPRVAWCILGHNGNWERLPKTANYELEHDDASGGIVDTQGNSWSVDLQAMEATGRHAGQKTKLKRLENHPDFTLPLYWDNMTTAETMKVVVLQPSSAEYRAVMEAFKRTVPKTITKIERVQNVHLHRAYEAHKKQMSDKNKHDGGAREKVLYHGTSWKNYSSIMKTGFNRSFAGQNATAFGHGTYFAVNASYSAQPTYSKPATDGSQLMFVARVLTGSYTHGQSDMKVPPPRNNQPDDRYDSLVDDIYNPSMYVVFHDSQAYPDYLITFRLW